MATQLGEYRDPGVCQLVTELTVDPDGFWLRATIPGQLDELMNDASFFAYISSATGAVLETAADGLRVSASALGSTLTGGGASVIDVADGAIVEDKIGTSAVTSTKIANDAVKTSNIQNIAVTLDKLALDARTDLGTSEFANRVEITNSTGSDATINLVGVNAGLMSPAQDVKLDGIAPGANAYVHPDHGPGGDAVSSADGPITINNDAITTVKIADANVTLAKLAADAVTQLTTSQTATELVVQNSTGTNAALPQATSTLAGLVLPLEHDALNPPTMTLVGNPDIATATAKGIAVGSLPTQPASLGSRFIGWDAGGLLAEFDPTALTADSRKADSDNLGTQSTGTLAINWDSGNYDIKRLVIAADLNTVTFTATRDGTYELHIVQDGTGSRKLNLGSVNTSPRLANVAINYTPGSLTVLKFSYNDSTGIWSW